MGAVILVIGNLTGMASLLLALGAGADLAVVLMAHTVGGAIGIFLGASMILFHRAEYKRDSILS